MRTDGGVIQNGVGLVYLPALNLYQVLHLKGKAISIIPVASVILAHHGEPYRSFILKSAQQGWKLKDDIIPTAAAAKSTAAVERYRGNWVCSACTSYCKGLRQDGSWYCFVGATKENHKKRVDYCFKCSFLSTSELIYDYLLSMERSRATAQPLSLHSACSLYDLSLGTVTRHTPSSSSHP